MTPFFSIITVCYNAEDTIARTIACIDAQDFAEYEHIIVDGASEDDTMTIIDQADKTKRTVLSEPDSGLYHAMNKGLAIAKGLYVIFLNAGDKFHGRDTLSRLYLAARDTMPDILYGQTVIVDNDGRNPWPRHLTAPPTLSVSSFARGMVVCHQAFVPSRLIASEYNLHYRFSADYDWCIRCLKHSTHNVYIGDEPMIDYLEGGLTQKNHWKSLWERYTIMCRHYGLIMATLRHVGFLFRDAMRKIKKQ